MKILICSILKKAKATKFQESGGPNMDLQINGISRSNCLFNNYFFYQLQLILQFWFL